MLEQMVRKFLYYPVRIDELAPPPRYAAGAREVWIPSEDGNRIHGLYWDSEDQRPTLLYFHGNAQSVFEWALVREELHPLECSLLLIDYPGYGKSTGTPTEDSLYRAGEACFEWLVETAGIPEEQIVLFGKSLGGGVVTHVAQARRPLGAVLESTFTSIPAVIRRLIPVFPADAVLGSERYESAKRVDKLDCPVFIIHGTRDELVPLEEGRRLFELATEPKNLWLVDGAGHNDVSLVADAEYGRRLREWIDEIRS